MSDKENTHEAVKARLDTETGLWVFYGGIPGPAGAESLELGSEVQFVVDRADPGRIIQVSLVLPYLNPEAAPDPEAVQVIKALLGPQAGALITGNGPAESTEIAVSSETVPVRQAASRLAVLEALRAEEAYRDKAVSKWWSVDASLLLHILTKAGVQHLAPQVRIEAQTAVSVLSELDAQSVPSHLAAKVAGAVRSLAGFSEAREGKKTLETLVASLTKSDSKAASTRGIWRRRLSEMRSYLIPDLGFPRLATVRGNWSDQQEGSQETGVQLDPRLSKFGIDVSRQATVVASHDGIVLQVPLRAGASPPRLWARAYSRNNWREPVVAALEIEGQMGVGRLSAPEQYDIGNLYVDVTDDLQETPSPSPLGRMRRACAFGAEATRAERFGEWDDATQAWEACAEVWGQIDDHDRRALALGYGAQAAAHSGDDYRSNELLEKARTEDIQGWSRPYLQAERDIQEPFLAEEVLNEAGATL